MKPECVLLDFDGTLSDTETENGNQLAEALKQYGVIMTQEEKRAIVGINDPNALLPMLARATRPVTVEEVLADHRRNTVYETGNISLIPGAEIFLEALRENRILTGLISSTSTRLIVTAANRLRITGLFDVILGGDMVKTLKPDPEEYLMAMSLLGVSPRACVIVEDSGPGILAGK